jgi:hypothetical protein
VAGAAAQLWHASLGRNTTGWPRVLWIAGTALLVTMIAHIAALVITGGPLSGPVSLRKPLTFAETGWLTAWSVALVLPLVRARAWQRHLIGVSVLLFTAGETAIIGFQAWRGVPSHYNVTTPLDAALMRVGAGGSAGVFLAGIIVLLIAAARTPGLTASVRLGISAGITVLLVGCLIGFVMISNNSGVYQGRIGAGFARQASGAGTYLGPDAMTVGTEYGLLRPATRGGDLLLPHLIGIHGLVLLAVPAVLLARTTTPKTRQLPVIGLATTSTGVALAILLLQAFRQLPLQALPPLAWAALALCAITLLSAYGLVATGLRHPAGIPSLP